MADLSTTYMGLALRNPIIVGSSGLTNSVQSIENLEQHGAGAVVLKSLFEEQIMIETDTTYAESNLHPEASDYLSYYMREDHLGSYLRLIADAKAAVDIPVIASVCCITASSWTRFAEEIQKAGADALELNVLVLPADPKMESDAIEKTYFDIVRQVLKHVSIPVALKVGYFFTDLAGMLQRVSQSGVSGLVMFNRSYQPDIDIDNEVLVPGHPYSSPVDLATSLRWIAIMAGQVRCDLAATTGVHDGAAVIKQLLAGATACQMVSSIYQNKAEVIAKSVSELDDWMNRHHYNTIADFRGKLSQSHVETPAFYERVQFLKHFGQI